MLEELFIQNFAIIKELRLNFSSGFNVITGETGSGKSIILGALNLLLGSKATTDQIRSGANRAIIQGCFYIPKKSKSKKLLYILHQHALDCEDNLLLLKREISTEGKGRSFINYQQVPVSLLKEISAFIIDVHGQNEHQQILKLETHRKILDRFSQLKELITFKKLYLEYHSLQQKLTSISLNEKDKERRLEILSHEIKEIQDAQLNQSNELEKLIQEEKKLANCELILSTLSEVYHVLAESEHSLKTQISKEVKKLDKIIEYDNSLEDITNQMHETYYQIEDITTNLRIKTESIHLDPEDLSKIQERISLLQNLINKYGASIPEILNYLEQAKNEYEGIQLSDSKAIEIKNQMQEILKKLVHLALFISKIRKNNAINLEKLVKNELNDLGMKDTQFKVSLHNIKDPNGLFLHPENNEKYTLFSYGVDQIEFLIGAFESEKLRSLRKIASGGEMSRIMLALKKVIVDSDPVFTMIFDEVDAGVGGSIAESIGKKLLKLSEKAQVIVITHLHQIASKSSNHTTHFKVTKSKDLGTFISTLNKESRLQEIARMISGEQITDSALEHAKKLLQKV